MTIYSVGYLPAPDSDTRYADAKLFFEHIHLFLAHSSDILQRPDYFFCPLSFAFGSWPFVGGSGPLRLGHLLIGWRDGDLLDHCLYCEADLYLYAFGGSPLSGSNWFAGKCITCGASCTLRNVSGKLIPLIQFAVRVRSQFPEQVTEVEEYDGFQFSWGGTGLRPARNQRQFTRRVCDPVEMRALILALA